MCRAVERANNLTSDGTVSIIQSEDGITLGLTPQEDCNARITASYGDGSYAWEKVEQRAFADSQTDPANSDGWETTEEGDAPAEGNEDLRPAWECNLNAGVPIGTVVHLRAHYMASPEGVEMEYEFDYHPTAPPAAPRSIHIDESITVYRRGASLPAKAVTTGRRSVFIDESTMVHRRGSNAGGGIEAAVRLNLDGTQTAASGGGTYRLDWADPADWEIGSTDWYAVANPKRLVVPAAYAGKTVELGFWVRLNYGTANATTGYCQKAKLYEDNVLILDHWDQFVWWGTNFNGSGPGTTIILAGTFFIRPAASAYYELEIYNSDSTSSVSINEGYFWASSLQHAG